MATKLQSTTYSDLGILTSISLVYDRSSDPPDLHDEFVAVDYAVEFRFSVGAPLEVTFSEGSSDIVEINPAKSSGNANWHGIDGAEFGSFASLIGSHVDRVHIVDEATAELVLQDRVCRVVGGRWAGRYAFVSPVEHFDCLFVTVLARKLRVAADYGAFPVWDMGAGGMVDSRRLPVSAELVAQLQAWAARYDATLNPYDPTQSGFASPDAAATFDRDGAALARDLQSALGAAFDVRYGAGRIRL